MKLGDLPALFIEVVRIVWDLITMGIVSNVIFEEVQWSLADLNKLFYDFGQSKILVQIIASVIGLILVVGYQLVSVEITIVWAEFVYSQWGVIGYHSYTPYLIVALSLVVYLCAAVWLKDPIKRKLHVPETA